MKNELHQILFKTWFNGWCAVSEEQAKKLAVHLYKHANGINQDEMIPFINGRFRGIQFDEQIILKNLRV